MERSDLAIIIPAYNEEKSIAAVIKQVLHLGRVIVVDDASGDRTYEVALASGAELVKHEKNKGYDQALESGFRKALALQCKFAVTIDADGQHDGSLVTLYANLLQQHDMVLGIRDRKQRVSEHIFAIVGGLFFGLKDPLCGMKGYRLSLYRDLGHFDSYGSIGTELALFGASKGYRLTHVKIKTFERQGKSRFGQTARANFVITRAMFRGISRFRPRLGFRSV